MGDTNTEFQEPEYTKADRIYIMVDHKQIATIQRAADLRGVAVSAKGRELLIEWARQVLKEEGA